MAPPQNSNAPKAANGATGSDLPPIPDPQQKEAAGEDEDDTPPTHHARPHNAEDAAAVSARTPASKPDPESEKREADEADKSELDPQKREEDEGDDAPSTQHARASDGGIPVAFDTAQQPPTDEVVAAQDDQGEQTHLKRGTSTEAGESLALKRGLRAPRKKRLAFAIAEASLPSPASSSVDASYEEYKANSWEDDDEDDDVGISMDLAQAEATQELEELASSDMDLEQKNPAKIFVNSMLLTIFDDSRGTGEKNDVIGALQLMMIASSAQEYRRFHAELLRSLGEDKKDPFYEYFDANWETCKEEWVNYHRGNVHHLNNHTNNRIESGWGKIKQVVDREDPIDELIGTLVMLQEWSEERYMKEFKSLGTRQTWTQRTPSSPLWLFS